MQSGFLAILEYIVNPMIPVDSKLPPETTIEQNGSDESKWFRIARITVGTALGAQAAILGMFAGFVFIFGLLLGGMASIVGGSQASEEKYALTWLMILVTITSPFLFAILAAISTTSILLRKGRVIIIIFCLAMTSSPWAIPYWLDRPIETGSLTAIVVAINLAGIVIALTMKLKKKSV